MCRRHLAFLVALSLTMGLSTLSAQERAQEKEIESATAASYVDMGIRLIVVERDEKNGRPMVPGNAEPMRQVGEPIVRGGIVKIYRDENGNRAAEIVGKSNNPVTWYASQAQADLILHDGPVPWALVQGSEGSGKTTVLAMWTAFRLLEHIGFNRVIAITAPTGPRLAHVKKAIRDLWPPRWFRWSERYQEYRFHAMPTVLMASAVQRSEDAGSPFQGGNWVAAASDELQDHSERNADIIARGRSAPREIGYKRLCTSTFKDSPTWRTFRAVADAARLPANDNANEARRLWHLTLLLGLESPFVPLSHWENMRAGLTDREYDRRVLAKDVGPERQLYYSWRRYEEKDGRKYPLNLRPLPVGYADVTARELAAVGIRNCGILLGHDPGKRQHVTEFLKAFEFPEQRRDANGRPLPPLVRWFAVDEVTTPESTMETHIARVLDRVRSKWRMMLVDSYGGGISANSPRALVRIDPHTPSGNEHPDRVVYSQWRNAGFYAMAAAYNPQTQKPTPIKVEARVDLINTLLCNTDGDRRLFVLQHDNGDPAAPKLVAAFEQMERNEQGDAEWERKDGSDLSHWPASVSFAVWSIEKPRVDALRARAS